jgi:hypothetical protein
MIRARTLLLAACLVAGWAQLAAAQGPARAAILRAEWTRIFESVTRARNLTVSGDNLTSATDPGPASEAVRAARWRTHRGARRSCALIPMWENPRWSMSRVAYGTPMT